MSFSYEGSVVTLQGINATEYTYACVSISTIQVTEPTAAPVEMQQLIDEFADVFAAPTELPPRRESDHHIPLIPGARPVTSRPYRIVPQLKDELERQINELLVAGVIRVSKSPFSSPVLLFKKKGGEWRLVVDYRMLNAITLLVSFQSQL